MKIIEEKNLSSFEFWSGAKDNVKMLSYEELDEIGNQLECDYPEGMTTTQVNDLFWFDFGFVCSLIGLAYDEENDEIIRENKNEDNEEEDI